MMNLLFIALGRLGELWDAFFFHPQPTYTICVIRVLTGMLVLADTVNWAPVYRTLLAPDGWYGTADYRAQERRQPRFSLLQYLPMTNASVQVLLALQGAAALCLALGIGAQPVALVCFLTLVSIHNRNPYPLNSGDTVLRFFCLFLAFAPAGTQFSVLDYPQVLHPEAHGWPWTLWMIRFFMANIYLKNVLFKVSGPWWRNGTATEKVFHVHLWLRNPLPNWLDHPWFYRASTWGTLAIETALFTLIWIEAFRLPLIVLGICFHLCLWYFLRVRLFQLAMITGLLAFLKPEEMLQMLG